MIFKTSRYAGVGIYTVIDAQGRAHRALKIRLIPPTPAVFRHTVQEGERLDLIAFNYYEKADRFWRVCDANNAVQPDELLQPGRKIRVPPDQTG